MIMDIIDSMVLAILPTTVLMVILLYFRDILKNFGNRNVYQMLKGLFCLSFTVAIVFSTFVVMTFDTYNAAIIMKDIELTYGQRQTFFIGIALMWNILGSVLVIGVWKFIYYNNHNLIYRIKEDLKKIKERKSHGRYEETN